MSVRRPTPSRSLPDELNSPRSKLVYLYLRSNSASLDDLQADLGIGKLTLYSVLRSLRESGFVEERDGQFAVVECAVACR